MNNQFTRIQILDEIRKLMSDGKARMARDIAKFLNSQGINTDKKEVGSILFAEGKRVFHYDNATYLYTYAETTSPAVMTSTPYIPSTYKIPSWIEPSINDKIASMNAALRDEIKFMRNNGGTKTFITDGTYIGDRNGLFVYVFTIDFELHFPNDTPIQVDFRNRKIDGTLLSIDGFNIVLALEEHLGEAVPVAILSTEPWFLLDKLKSRLEDVVSRSVSLEFPRKLLASTVDAEQKFELRNTGILSRLNKYTGLSLQLNNSQLEAIEHVISSDISFIWGPPGTGKSTTLGATVTALIEKGQSVLVLAHSNIAVDVAMLSIGNLLQHTPLFEEGSVIRLGTTQHPDMQKPSFEKMHIRGILRRLYPDLIKSIEKLEQEIRQAIQKAHNSKTSETEQQQLLEQLEEKRFQLKNNNEKIKEHEKHLLKTARIVGCTFSKLTLSEELQLRRFDNVFIDEASMAFVPHCVFASTFAVHRVAVYGDFRQLPPIAQADTEEVKNWLLRDVFDHAGIINRINKGVNDRRLKLLRTQYRMHTKIADIPNSLFYQNQLITPATVIDATSKIAALQPAKGEAILTVDMSNLYAYCVQEKESRSRFNLISAIYSILYLDEAISSGLSVGIETPYNAQARLINRMVRDLKYDRNQTIVATVHRFQGSERDVIIFDTVEGHPMLPSRLMVDNGDTPDRLANVAISRAKGKFVLISNPDYIQTSLPKDNGFRKLTQQVTTHGKTVKPIWNHATATLIGHSDQDIKQYRDKDALRAIKDDLLSSKEEVAISWTAAPYQPYLSEEWLQATQGSRKRLYITGTGSKQFRLGLLNTQVWEAKSPVDYCFIGIDRKVLWVFMGIGTKNETLLRLKMPLTVQLLYAFFSLVPKDEVKTEMIETRIAQGKNPLGTLPCPNCGEAVWPTLSEYGLPILICSDPTCGYTRRMDVKSATEYARLMGLVCDRCGGQAIGKKGDSGVFIGCSNYPRCRWTKRLSDLI